MNPPESYAFLALFLLVAFLFALFPILLSRLVHPKKPSQSKNDPYECGLQSAGDPWIQFRVQFYLYALVFVIFDIEILFIYPWAVVFKDLGLLGFVEMAVFIGILLIGLVYAWRKRALEWG